MPAGLQNFGQKKGKKVKGEESKWEREGGTKDGEKW